MIIHIIGTVNGQVNEGMRNVATHLARTSEKENTVLYSGLKQVPNIAVNSAKADVTLIFARANKLVYWLTHFVRLFCKNVWIVLVQKPDKGFLHLNEKKMLKCNYLSITQKDLDVVEVAPGYRKALFAVGIQADKFTPVTSEQQQKLKRKYDFDPNLPLVLHVGHCSIGRGLEDFAKIQGAQCMVVASGMFENEAVVKTLQDAHVRIHKGYLENVEEVYQMADAYLFPTRSVEFVISVPLSVTEALSCGVPVIGYRSFDNLNEIASEDGAVTLIDNTEDINSVLSMVTAKKCGHSLLRSMDSWDAVAVKVLKLIGEK